MTSNVTPFPTGTRVTSENIGIGGGLYYRLESMARRVHFLLEVANQQDSPEPGKTYRYIRKRTVKRCFLAIAQKGINTEEKLKSLRNDGGYEIAVNIFLDLLEEKKGAQEDTIERLRNVLSGVKPDKKDFELIVEFLTGFNLTPSQIIQVFNGHIQHKIQGYNDDTYTFLRRIQQLPIQD